MTSLSPTKEIMYLLFLLVSYSSSTSPFSPTFFYSLFTFWTPFTSLLGSFTPPSLSVPSLYLLFQINMGLQFPTSGLTCFGTSGRTTYMVTCCSLKNIFRVWPWRVTTTTVTTTTRKRLPWPKKNTRPLRVKLGIITYLLALPKSTNRQKKWRHHEAFFGLQKKGTSLRNITLIRPIRKISQKKITEI